MHPADQSIRAEKTGISGETVTPFSAVDRRGADRYPALSRYSSATLPLYYLVSHGILPNKKTV
jgi:hypothetical protein